MSLIRDFFDTYINNIFVVIFMTFFGLIAMFFKLKPEIVTDDEDSNESKKSESAHNLPSDVEIELLRKLDEFIVHQQNVKFDVYYDQLLTLLRDMHSTLQSLDQKLYALTTYVLGITKQLNQQTSFLEDLQSQIAEDRPEKKLKKLDDLL